MNTTNKYSGAFSRRRYSNFTAKFTVSCTSGEPNMGSVKLEPVSTPFGTAETAAGQVNPEKSGSYTSGSYMKATAVANSGYKFVGWKTNIEGIGDTSSNPVTFKLTKATTLVAHFAAVGGGTTSKTVHVVWNGKAGRVSSTSRMEYGSETPASNATLTAPTGSNVQLEAIPNQGYHFVKWIGGPSSIDGRTEETRSFNVNGNYTITALFAEDEIGSGGGGNGGNGGGGGENILDFTPTNIDRFDVMAFLKKWWWVLAIAAYIYYDSKKGGSK